MAKSRIGKKSKRLPCAKRYKIEKRIRQHNKKVKKQKENKLKRTKLNKHKDPGVPNSCPFKEEILREAQQKRDLLEEERKKRNDKRKKDKEKIVNKKRNLETLVSDATKRTDEFEKANKHKDIKSADGSLKGAKRVENSLKAFYKEVKTVIENSDVVIEVLDARDPLGSRCPQVEQAVISSGVSKKLVLLLNKIDLVPKENVELWLKYLRNEFPSIAFKSSTQSQNSRLAHSHVPLDLASDNLRKGNSCLGVEGLMTLLANYCRNVDIKTSITIGVVGFPNTGKSSVINSLKRSKACNVGSTPGVTKQMQLVQLDKHIKLLDSPGVVMATNLENEEAVILRNCVKTENLIDPIPAVNVILSRCNREQLMMLYCIPQYKDLEDFLQLLARRFGMLKKGGRLDLNKTAKLVIKDWNSGKITYYTIPPENYVQSAYVSSEIVQEMAKAFDIDSLVNSDSLIIGALKKSGTPHDSVIKSSLPTDGSLMISDQINSKNKITNESNNDDEIDDESDNNSENEDEMMSEDTVEKPKVQKFKVDILESTKKKGGSRRKQQNPHPLVPLPGNRQLNKDRQKQFKKGLKQRKKSDILAGNLASIFEKSL